MNKKHLYFFAALFLGFSIMTTGCSDFLDKEPMSSGTEAIAFKNAEQFEQAANALYHMEGWKTYENKNNYEFDGGTDLRGFGSNGGGSAGEGNTRAWNKPYEFIRESNIVLEKATEYTGDQSEIAASVGTAYFFRAWQHYYLLTHFGGVPIADHSFDVTDPALYGPRSSRYEVAKFIIDDLRKAVNLLPKQAELNDEDYGKVTTEAAKSFLARVLLYEATWEKYVPGIGYDLDGDGTSIGAGTAKPEGYPSVNEMLTEAKQMSREVIEEAEKGTFQLWNECDSLSYYYLFSIDEKGGNICNFMGAGKATNKEFIFSVKYDYDVKRSKANIAHTLCSNQGFSYSAIFARSFLCRNGLPLRISRTGRMEDAQNNPQFSGYDTFTGEFYNRDYRFVGCTYIPDRSSWKGDKDYGIPCTELGKPYPDPVFPEVPYNPNDPAFSSKAAVFTPTLYGGTHSGYSSRKFMPEGGARANETESPDWPLIRLAEVHLIYAEATCELGGGEISDEDLDFSVNKNRTRARVAPLTNGLIAGIWDAGWCDHTQNKTVCKKMNMLDEIRRERACELYGERLRWDDLKRWGVAHIYVTGQKLGRQVYNSAYMTNFANDATHHGDPCYMPDTYPLTYGVYEGTGPSDPDYGRSIVNDPANSLYTQRDYLTPIPLGQIRLNPQLKQNPGW